MLDRTETRTEVTDWVNWRTFRSNEKHRVDEQSVNQMLDGGLDVVDSAHDTESPRLH